MRLALLGWALLSAVLLPPEVVHSACPPPSEEETRSSVRADIGLVDTFAKGRLTCRGGLGVHYVDSGRYIPYCGWWWHSGPSLTLLTPPYGGVAVSPTCTEVCENESLVAQDFTLSLEKGRCYIFAWNFPYFLDTSYVYVKRLCVPLQSPDAPTCPVCVGGAAGACITPKQHSLTISPRPDLVLASPLGNRTIERTYRTSRVGDAAAGDGMFGKGWRANFEYQIDGGDPAGLMLFDAAGRKLFYQDSGTPGVYVSPDGNGGEIARAADGSYRWQDEAGTSFQFDSSGSIRSITDVRGNQETLGYESAGGRITSLIDRHGRIVTFDYQETTHVRRLLGPSIAANPSGVYATYSYDANGNLTGVAYADGSTVVYGYEEPSWPSHMTRHLFSGSRGPDFQQRFQYDSQGRVAASSEGPEGRSYRLVYASEQVAVDPLRPELGQMNLYHTTVTEWTDADWDFQINGGEVAKAERTYWYENRGGAEVVTKIEGGGCPCAAEKTYDSAFHVVQSSDDGGVITRMTYGERGDRTSLVEAAGTPEERITGYDYVYPSAPVFPGQILQKTTRRKSVVLPGEEQLVEEVYDPVSGALQIRRELGFTSAGEARAIETAFAYTAAGAIQSIDGPRPGAADRVVYEYHPAGSLAAGMLWKIIEPNGAVTTLAQYDGLGNLLRKTDANNRDTVYTYGSRGFRESQSTVDGETRYEYDADGNLSKTTYPRGNSASYNHGQSGISRVEDAAGRIEFGYAHGNRISESIYDAAGGLNKSTSYDYDSQNRLWRTRQASGDFEELLYDVNGNETGRKLYAAGAPSEPFKTTIKGYDSLGRLAAVSVEGDPYRVSYGYDARGNLSSMVDPVGQATGHVYDDFSRLGRVISPETGTTSFTHDEAGNITSRTDNLGRSIAYAYDASNRLVDVAYQDAAPPAHYRYDDYSAGSYPDAVGRLTELTDASGLRRFFYHPSGRLSKVVHSIDDRDFATEYGYDANGNLASLTYPGGRRIEYEYEPLSDSLRSVTAWKYGVPTVLADGIAHKPFGPLIGFDYGNGARLARTSENLEYKLDSVGVTGPGDSPLPNRTYGYDPAGNVSEITRDLAGGPERHVYTYDLMDRLAGWTAPGRSREFTYDANGNRQSFSADGQITDYSYDPVLRNILVSSSGAENLVYVHDLLGRITGWDSTGLVYDGSDRLVRAERAGYPLAEYVYNADGQRVKKAVAGVVTYFEYGVGGQLLHEYSASDGSTVDYVYLEGEPLAMLVSDGIVERWTVTPSVEAHGSLVPSIPQVIEQGQTVSFGVIAEAGYHASMITGCGGAFDGDTYTTGPITTNCTVSASFTVNEYVLTTTKTGSGDGTVTSVPAGISCGPACSMPYRHGTVVSLLQVPSPGSVFTGWGGDCAVVGGDCTIGMTAARTAAASFSQGITVAAPNGSETVSRNTTTTIRWSYCGDPGGTVRVELLKGGVLSRVLARSTTIGSGGAGSFAWKVLKSQAIGSDYSIRVVSKMSGAFTDTSDAFFTVR